MRMTPIRWVLATLLLSLGSVSCAIVNDGGDGSDDDDGATVCDLADEFQACPECDDGDTTCTFEGTSVTRNSCQECQARGALFQQLCDDDADTSAADVEAGTTCTTVPGF